MSMFRKPATKLVGAKVLVMGETGVGKSVFALSFPKAYALDSEAGLSHYENGVFGANLLGVANTADFNDLSDAIDEIGDMVEEDEGAVGTLIIDSETKIYNNLTDSALTVEEKKARKAGRDVMDSAVSMRGWGRVKAVAQRLSALKIDLSAKGVNIISVSQIDDIKVKNGDNFVKVGEKPVMQKGSEYDYDIVIKLFTEKDATGKTYYKGEIRKDRTGVTQVGQIIDNPSYNVWREYYENRQGAGKITSNLVKDSEKGIQGLEKEDREAEKTTVDKLRELMGKSKAHKTRGLELIKASGVKNPLAPANAQELKKIEQIVEVLTSL